MSILKLVQYKLVCVYTHNQLLEFVWCGTHGDVFGNGTCRDLVVVSKTIVVLALVQARIMALDLYLDQVEQFCPDHKMDMHVKYY